MKKIYIAIATLALSASTFAQTADSLLRRQMELERDFNPTLLDADKINSLPALREPVVQKANTNYSSWAGRTTPPLEIALPQPGNIMTAIPFSTKKGYLSFNAGNYANMDGAFGYRIVDNEKNNLFFNFLHNSTNGDIKYVQNSDPASQKAYLMDNKGSLAYLHRADALMLNIDLSYLHSAFNYYGNRLGNSPAYDNMNQGLGVLNTRVGVTSHESELLNYRGYIDYRNFSTKLGDYPGYEGVRGNEINAMVGFDKPFNYVESKIGVDGKIFSTFYNGNLDNFFLINAAPYVYFGNAESHAKLGADVIFQLTGNTKIRVAPNVELQWAVTPQSSLYANIHGGVNNNTLLQMMQESRYIRPNINVKPSFSIIDIEVGTKIGELDGFRFDIFGGYKKTDDEHFLILKGKEVIDGIPHDFYREVLQPIYGDLSHSHIGGMIQSNIWAPLDISLRFKKNFYGLNNIAREDQQINDPKAYNKPGFEVDLRASLEVTTQLKLTANYHFAGDRWSYSYVDGANLEMNNINDLNAGALFQINDAFSVNVRANNLLNQKYDIWYGHPAQGFNASGGFTFRF